MKRTGGRKLPPIVVETVGRPTQFKALARLLLAVRARHAAAQAAHAGEQPKNRGLQGAAGPGGIGGRPDGGEALAGLYASPSIIVGPQLSAPRRVAGRGGAMRRARPPSRAELPQLLERVRAAGERARMLTGGLVHGELSDDQAAALRAAHAERVAAARAIRYLVRAATARRTGAAP